MNGSYYYPQQGFTYGSQCPYKNTCPIRTECPYCPHRMEDIGNINPGYYGGMYPENYGNMNMGMGYYENKEMYPNTAINPEGYGYDNLYPMADYKSGNFMPEFADNKTALYNQYGYISPAENINSPWDNNRMYENINNPLPIPKCPYQ